MKDKLKAIVARLLEIEREIENLGDEILKADLATPSLEALGEELSALSAVRFGLGKLLEDME